MFLDLLFEVRLKLAEEFEVGARMEPLHAPKVARKQAPQVFILGAVQEDTDIEGFPFNGVWNILDQKKRTFLKLGSLGHGGDTRVEGNLPPVREGPQVGVLGVNNRLTQTALAFRQPLRKPLELSPAPGAPFSWNIACALLDLPAIQILNSREIGLEVLETADAFVNQPAGIDIADGAVGEIPLPVVKAEALVNEPGGVGVGLVVDRPGEDHLPSIAVAGPLVEHKSSQESGAQSADFAQKPVGQEIHDQGQARIARKTRAKRQPSGAWLNAGSRLDDHLRVAANEFVGHFDKRRPGHGKPYDLCQPGCEHLVGKDAGVLGIVLEFDDVIHVVLCAQEARLRSATHATDELNGHYRGESNHFALGPPSRGGRGLAGRPE